MNTETTAEYGLRSSYRFKGTKEVLTQDFFGENKADESAKFNASIRDQVDYCSVTVTHKE